MMVCQPQRIRAIFAALEKRGIVAKCERVPVSLANDARGRSHEDGMIVDNDCDLGLYECIVGYIGVASYRVKS